MAYRDTFRFGVRTALGAALFLAACPQNPETSDDGGLPDGGGNEPGPVCTDCTKAGAMTTLLPSPAGAKLWTTPTLEKVLREAAVPTMPGDSITLYAAKNEYEPFQIVVRPDATGNATLAISDFSGPGTIAKANVELRKVGYVRITTPSDASSIMSTTGYMPDPLELVPFGTPNAVTALQNQPYWLTVYVPPGAAAGDYTATLTVTAGTGSQNIPIKLHVYDFALPSRISFDGNWNASFQALGGSASLAAVQTLKDFFFAHRLVPSSVGWPAGLNYNGGITYDCNGAFTENTADPYEFYNLGPKYIDGTGWNGVGFPSFQAMTFVNNSTPRPDTFCSVARGGDHFGTTAYNAKWSQLLSTINGYIVPRSWQNKAYYYVQNEPQGPADYDVAAHLAYLSKTAAPNLRIAISEEPKPEIVENPRAMGKSYDLWWANLSEFKPDYAKTRQAVGEDVWWYFLYGDRPPRFNPITIDHSGVESRIAFFAAWKYRIKGFAYYSVTGWGADPYNNPAYMGTGQNGDGFLLYPPKSGQLVSSIRWELLRDGAEDFEYFLLASGGPLPRTPDIAAPVDTSVLSAVSSTTSYTRDATALQHLRNQLGLKIEGKVNGFPVLDSKPPGQHQRAAYYLNFQDPAGMPTQSPLVVNGHTWTKVGWDAYSAQKGYGWAGPYIGDPMIMKYQYRSGAPDVLQASIIYNDYGRTDTFNWDLENGKYKVTVSIGWEGGNYPKNKVIVEGLPLFDNVATTAAQPYKVATIVVNVSDGNLTMEAGQTNEYTMLNWLSIEPEP